MKFPQIIRHRRAEAKIYGKTDNYAFYRVGYYLAGKRHIRHFPTYTEAKTTAERIVRELANGSQAAALSSNQSRDALASLQKLEGFRQSTGKRVSLLAAVSEYVEAANKLPGHTLSEAVERFLNTVASVKQKDIGEAVEEFIAIDEPRTKATQGQRPQLSPKYAYNRAIQLRRFAEAFPNTSACDLGKEHLDALIGSLGDFSAKSRNHHRAAFRQFLQWAVRKDYLSRDHRLGEADAMRPERANTAEVEFYTSEEFQSLLENSENSMRAIIAIAGLAGLRTAELLRLEWSDVWHVHGHVEISKGKAKTRQRRLVEICPALTAWLEQYRTLTTGRLWTFHEITFQQYFLKLCNKVGVKRKPNGLRHSYCSFHYALHGNENLTSAQAGNSPAMVHSNYKGLVTKEEAEKWFNVMPAKSDNVIALDPVA